MLKFITVPANQKTMNVTRRSDESTVTISFGKTFRDLSRAPPTGAERDRFNFCGCGWPQHMLISRGTEQGYPCELFVMVSDWQKDKVQYMNI